MARSDPVQYLETMKLAKLPGWIVPNEQSVWEETADSRAMSPNARVALLAALCRAGAKLLAMNDRRDYVLHYREPLPASSEAILARLRRTAGKTARS